MVVQWQQMDISVVIPVYNAERFVEQAVRSALMQPETAEVVLVEDGSINGSLEICQRLADADSRVRLARHPGGRNRGAAASRNLGIERAKCEWIAFLDADDWFLPERFAVARGMLENDRSLDGTYEPVGTWYENQAMRDWVRQRGIDDVLEVRQAVPPERLFETLVQGGQGCFSTDGLVVRKSLLVECGPFETTLRQFEDIAMWIKIAAMGRLAAGSRQPVAMRRLHGANTICQYEERYWKDSVEMWALLVRWSRSAELSPQRRMLLIEAELRWAIWRQRDAKSPPRLLRLSELCLLLRFLGKYPSVVRSALFRQYLAASSGWRRVGRLFSRASAEGHNLLGPKP